MLKRIISIGTLLLLVSSATLAQQPTDKVKAYYDSLKDGLTVTDLEQFRTLTEDEKKLAAALLSFQSGAAWLRYNACCSNLKNYATALEMWSTDHDDSYPQDGESVHPYYLAFGVSCPNSEKKPYGYELKDGTYYLNCSGDHSELGLDPPNYNGEIGLSNYADENMTKRTWKLKDYKITEIPSEFDDYLVLRIEERWTYGPKEAIFHSQVSPIVEEGKLTLSRPLALTSESILVAEGSDANKTVAARLLPTPLVDDEAVVESFEGLGPAMTGITVLRFLEDEEFAEARASLLEIVNADD